MGTRVGREIFYCSKCARQLSGRDLETGAAVRIADSVSCQACAPARPRPSGKTTAHLRTVRPPAPGASGGRLLVWSGLVAGVAAVFLGVVFLGGDGKTVEAPPASQAGEMAPAPAVRAPDGPEVEARAAEALQWARAFRAKNPRDLDGQVKAFALAVKDAGKTASLEPARREHGRVVAERFSRARILEALDGRAGGLVAWWKLDEGKGDIAGDSSGNGHTARSTNLRWIGGRAGGGLAFGDGTPSLAVSIADLPAPWTASMWVRRDPCPDVAATLLDSPAGSLRLEQYPRTQKVGITRYGAFDASFEYTAPPGEWVHLTFVGTESGTALFTNGAAAGSVPGKIDLPLACIGSSRAKGMHSFRGAIDELRAYQRALTPEEIRILYENPPSGKP